MSIPPIYVFFIALSFGVSFLVYRQPGAAFYLKLFPPFLGLSLFVEIFALYLISRGGKNYILYSFFGAIEFAFYLYILSFIIQNLLTRKIIRYILVFNFLVSLSNIFFIQKDRFNSITYSLGCLLIVFFCIYYFFELFRYPKSIKLSTEPAFWICSGLLFYYCCSFPLLGLTSLLSLFSQTLLRNIYLLLNVMNFLLYTSFTVAFLCRIRIRKYISS